MTMREFLDTVLDFIDVESLTDEEYDNLSLAEDAPVQPSVATYLSLKGLLEERGEPEGTLQRLRYYFLSADVQLSTEQMRATPRSQIWIGSRL